MARTGAQYKPVNGSKIEYKKTSESTWTRIYGMLGTPQIGGTPSQIDTTDLDNEEFETSINGLMPAQQYEINFNMEDPTATANIYLASTLEDSGEVVDWRITYSNGISVQFESDVRTSWDEGNSGDLQRFTMYLAPQSEPVREIPTV